MDFSNQKRSIARRSAAYEVVLAACKDLLQQPIAEEARAYLDQRMSKSSQEAFEFGYFPNDYHLGLLVDRVGLKLLSKLQLVQDYHIQVVTGANLENKGWFGKHNIITPYRDQDGNIVAFVGRTTLPETERGSLHKYHYTRNFEKSLHLYGFYKAKRAIREQNSVILVEGQIDCITCHEYGKTNVVALGGTSLSKPQFYLLSSYAKHFYLLLDNDESGTHAQKQIIQRYSKYASFRKLSLPSEFKDVDECLRNASVSSRDAIFQI